MKRSLSSTLRVLLLVGIVACGVEYLGGDMYLKSRERQKRAVLREDLTEVCQAVNAYTLDQQHAPRTLQDLVASKYLHEVPTDPNTLKKDWVLVSRNISVGIDQESVRLIELRSASDRDGNDGVTCQVP